MSAKMHPIQLNVLNLCILLTLHSLVCGQIANIPKPRNANAMTRMTIANNEYESKIYNINKRPRNLLHRQTSLVAAAAATSAPSPSPSSTAATISATSTANPAGKSLTKTRTPSKNTHTLNKKLLKTLGFTKIKAPNSHNRKRLAIESRYQSADDDSHMFIIKLAPNVHYYANPNAVAGVDVGQAAMQSMLQQMPHNFQNLLEQHQHQQQQQQQHHQRQPQPQQEHQHEQQQHKQQMPNNDNNNDNNNNEHTKLTATNSLGTSTNSEQDAKKVSSLGFSWNGRLNRIYHWNLPVIKKLLNDKKRFPHLTSAAVKNDLTDIRDVPTWSKPWENDVVEKSFAKNDYKKSLKRKSPSYYAPTNVVNNKSFNKYFAGNGKPKGFYVIKENQKKPFYHKNIIS